MKRECLLGIAMLLSGTAAWAQSADSTTDGGRLRGTVSVGNVFEGNINHELNPVRSYGIVPSGLLWFESSRDPAFAAGYELALNNFSGTDQWDRISHSAYSVWSYRVGRRVRLETGGSASWKGSSDDRELANEFGVSQRLAYRLSSATRVVLSASYRYKEYPDDPGTSGPSPNVGAKIDQRLSSSQRLVFAYKYQRRLSQVQRDRYRRAAVTMTYSTALPNPNERFSAEFEYRPQRYERLIKVGDHREWRLDRRFTVEATYERPLNHRAIARWSGGFEARDSNDPNKRFFAPSLNMTVSYRVR